MYTNKNEKFGNKNPESFKRNSLPSIKYLHRGSQPIRKSK
jgi:hypothetical protein